MPASVPIYMSSNYWKSGLLVKALMLSEYRQLMNDDSDEDFMDTYKPKRKLPSTLPCVQQEMLDFMGSTQHDFEYH